MANYAVTRNRKLPSQRTIAFAVSIVRLKPPELSVAEYIKLLRQHTAKGRRENALSAAYRHLDRSSYWRAEFERMKVAFDSIEDENADLRRQVEGLKEKASSAKAGPARKRKRVDGDITPVPKSPKKAKAGGTLARKDGTPFDLDADLDLTGLGDAGDTMVRSLFRLHLLLKPRQTFEAPDLAYYLIRAAETLPQATAKAIKQCMPPDNDAVETFKSVITAVGRSFRSLMEGFDKLVQVSDIADAQGHVTYAFVQMYNKLVDLMGGISSGESQNTAVTSAEQNVSSSRKAKQLVSSPTTDVPLLNVLTKFLCFMVDELDAKLEPHKALFEGFAFAVLTRLGPKLYTVVFGHHRGQDVAEEISMSNELAGSEEDISPLAERSNEAQLIPPRLEAPYLVHLLNHIMTAAPAHLGAVISAKTGKPKTSNNKGSMKGALTVAAKERLQRTLVNCMFGEGEGEGEEKDPFKDCLSMPVIQGAAVPMPKLKGVDVKDWFQEEVWSLLGWEILSKERDW